MPANTAPPLALAPFIPVIIDVERYYMGKLPFGAARPMLATLTKFTNDVRPYAPILRVAFDRKRNFPGFATDQQRKRIILNDAYGLGCLPVHKDDAIYIKNEPTAAKPAFFAAMPPPNQTVLGFAGVFTSECVVTTLTGSLQRGHRCIVMPDALGDYKAPEGRNLAWHQDRITKYIQAYMPERMNQLRFIAADDVATAVKNGRPVWRPEAVTSPPQHAAQP